jgi:dihydropteroate synthase
MTHFSLNCRGRLLDLSRPVVMGILNVTPDSFYDGGRHADPDAALRQAEKMLSEGAAILDVGGASSRPGAAEVPEQEELRRTEGVVRAIAERFPEAIISIDTWRPGVARAAVAAGAGIVNDISGGLSLASSSPGGPGEVAYILMHMQGTPATMQQAPHYADVVTEVLDFFIQKIAALRAHGVRDIVLDPGFGFGKTLEHNYALLRHLHVFRAVTGLPVLAGLSRKSMIYKPLGIGPEQALSGTSALHMVALQQGASILRAHDVREAVEVVRLWEMIG